MLCAKLHVATEEKTRASWQRAVNNTCAVELHLDTVKKIYNKLPKQTAKVCVRAHVPACAVYACVYECAGASVKW